MAGVILISGPIAGPYCRRRVRELSGQQYLTDTGPMDIFAISKDKKELLVVELKKGRASDELKGRSTMRLVPPVHLH
jgi:restriction system protein